MMKFLEAAARQDPHALQRALDLVEPFTELESLAWWEPTRRSG